MCSYCDGSSLWPFLESGQHRTDGIPVAFKAMKKGVSITSLERHT